MPIRNQNFYSLQSTRRYPLDDLSTGTDDRGVRLRDNILADLHIRFPVTLGNYVYVSGISVTKRLVTVTFLAATSQDTAAEFTPLAAITLVKPVIENRQYLLEALYPGVGGWVVFGSGISEDFTGRFSAPTQSLVLAKCARPYRPLPIPSIGKLFRDTALTGIINIKAGADLEIGKKTVSIDGSDRDALVVRLTGAISNRNPLQAYVSPCFPQPESENCLKPGVEYINTVQPDCNGNITIQFTDSDVAPYRDCGGLAVEHTAELAEVCAASDVPFDGPRYRDLCLTDSSSESLSSSSIDETPPLISSISESMSSEFIICDTLPHCESFDYETAENFVIKSGLFTFEEHDSPGETCDGAPEDSILELFNKAYVATAGYIRNVSVWEACAYESSLNKRCIVELQLTNNNAQRNGGVVVNWHVLDPYGLARVEYFLVSLDHNKSKVRVLRFTGTGFIEEFASGVLPIAVGDWYRLEVTTTSVSPTQVSINVTTSGVSNPAFPTTSFSLVTTKFLPADGAFGVGSNNAYTRFSFFKLEEL
jgi:hypothetical protein